MTDSPAPTVREIVGVYGIALVILAIILFPLRHVPYYWDGLGYVLPHSLEIHRRNLFPFLLDWDVGHPTLVYWLIAAMMKVVGVGPLAGHLVMLGFAALLFTGVVFGLRLLGPALNVAVLGGVVACTFPLVATSFAQILLDMPMTALSLVAICCWGNGWRRAATIFASAAALSKFYGFLVVPALMIAEAIRSDDQHPRARRVLQMASPLLPLLIFFVIRTMLRGSDLVYKFDSPNGAVPVWRWDEFQDYFGIAWRILVVESHLHWLAIPAAVITGVYAWKFRVNLRDPMVPVIVPAIVWCVLLTAMLFQYRNLCARYYLPVVIVVLMGMMAGLFKVLTLRFAVPMAVGMAALFVARWAPERFVALGLEEPIRYDHQFENDFTFLDAIDAVEWGASQAPEGARISSRWPWSEIKMEGAGYRIPRGVQLTTDKNLEAWLITIQPADSAVTLPTGFTAFAGKNFGPVAAILWKAGGNEAQVPKGRQGP